MYSRNGVEGMEGDAGEEEIREVEGKVYKVRPFGIDPVNIRELNPSGMCLSLVIILCH